MKKVIKSGVMLSSYGALFFLLNCGKKDTAPTPANCSLNAGKVTEAATTYGGNPTKANCEAYKNAVRDFYKSCSTFYPAAQKKALDEFLAEPCP